MQAQSWIRQNAFADLTSQAGTAGFNVDDFWSDSVNQFKWNDKLYAIPNTVAPDVLYFNKAMFDKAGVAYPTDNWTFDDLRDAAIKLTLDDKGRNPTDSQFDAARFAKVKHFLSDTNIHYGGRCGFAYGELFALPTHLGAEDFFKLVMGGKGTPAPVQLPGKDHLPMG